MKQKTKLGEDVLRGQSLQGLAQRGLESGFVAAVIDGVSAGLRMEQLGSGFAEFQSPKPKLLVDRDYDGYYELYKAYLRGREELAGSGVTFADFVAIYKLGRNR